PSSSRRSLGLDGALADRADVAPLGGLVSIPELHHRARGGIAVAEPGFEHAGVAAIALLVAGAEHFEQLLDHGDVAQFRDRLPARMQAAALAERDQLLDDRPQILGLRQRGDDLLVLDQRGRHVGEHGAAMLGRAVELAVDLAVAHQYSSDPVVPAERDAREPEPMIAEPANNRSAV